jgi:hypothetical protein
MNLFYKIHLQAFKVFCKINSFLKRKHTVWRTFKMTHVDRICIFTTSSEKHYRVLDKILYTEYQASCMWSATLLSICDNIWCLGPNICAWIHTKVSWVKAPFSVGGYVQTFSQEHTVVLWDRKCHVQNWNWAPLENVTSITAWANLLSNRVIRRII